MKKAYITEKCLGDPICLARLRCSVKAIKKSEQRTKIPLWFFTRSIVNQEICIGCGKCVKMCPHTVLSYVKQSDLNIKQKRKKNFILFMADQL